MRSVRILLCAALTAAVALPASAHAKRNPYTAVGVCGPGFRVIDRKPLFDTNPSNGNRIRLAAVVLTYNSATGQNCAVTLKRYRVGKVDRRYAENVYVSLAARPISERTVDGDSGAFKYYAGPAYVPARGRCVQWSGGASLRMQAYFESPGYYNSAYKSRWEHCG